jgi:threonine/homoserine/homoserine lactone efflux protein
VKWIGAAYLVIYGLRLIFSKDEPVRELAIVDHKSHHLFFNGFTLQISNPKAILFFSALLPQFLNPHAAIVPQVVILGITSVVIEFSILLAYGIAGSSLTPRYARWTNRVAGGLLIGAGAGIATR